MRCPVCGSSVTLALALAEAGEPPEAEADPLAATVRRLEAEQYGSPEPLPDYGGGGITERGQRTP
jgi:hypothetical protein